MKKESFILIAEDNEADVFFWTRALRTVGLDHYHIVGNGAEAIEYLQSGGRYTDRQTFPFPDFLLLDANMPVVSGYDVLEWVREHPLREVVPTLLFMGVAHAAASVRGYQLGANACFEKPVNSRELSLMLTRIIGYWNSALRPEPIARPTPLGRTIRPETILSPAA